MTGRVTEVVGVATLATVVVLLIAVATLRSPSDRVFGMAIVGRHHDPFTTMAQFEGAPRPAMYWQPLTDVPAGVIARLTGGVAAYNWIVLLSFPLAAVSAFLLARHLSLSPAGATLAAMAFAFAPFHVAHAAYHPHIAQVEWIPLYLLALWRCLDRGSFTAAALLAAAAGAVALSNFYGGLIALAITLPAAAAYALDSRESPRMWRNAVFTVSVLAVAVMAGVAYAMAFAPALVANRFAFAFPAADLVRYSAMPTSYLIPPVASPFFGERARQFWDSVGKHDGMLEQQVFLGWSLIALALVAVWRWLTHRDERARVPVLVGVAAIALYFSIAPPAWLYSALPMFRSYARFGVVVQLMTALAAGIGFDVLRRGANRRLRQVAAVFVILLVGEYAVSPMAMSRDVLPTMAHRWVAEQPRPILALDCVPLTAESQSIPSLSGQRIAIADPSADCAEPEFARKLAATGFTHLLIRRSTPDERRLAAAVPTAGLRVAATFADSQVLEVSAQKPAIYTAALAGFSPREHDTSWSWRWMGSAAAWTIKSTSPVPITATLDLQLSAFSARRHLDVLLDGKPVVTLDVGQERETYEIGPLSVTPGDHVLTFRPLESASVADTVMHNRDLRSLSFAFGAWHWLAEGAR